MPKLFIKMNLLVILFLLMAFSSAFGAVCTGTSPQSCTVPYPQLMEEYYWSYGCTPTAAAMVLGYWDNYVSGTGKFMFGRLIDYYRIDTHNNDDTQHSKHNIPNILEELKISMSTASDGDTSFGNISSGVINVTNTSNAYSFSSNMYEGSINCPDWCWGRIVNEINNNRPFIWNINWWEGLNYIGHSLAALGYRDDKYVILYDTWWQESHLPVGAREDWYYKYAYHNGGDHIISRAQVNHNPPSK